MHVDNYAGAAAFLAATQAILEQNEPANSLILGLAMRLARRPERAQGAPYLATVRDEQGLALAAMLAAPRPLIVYGHRGRVDQAARALARDLAAGGWAVPGVRGPLDAAAQVAAAWTEITGRAHRLVQRTIAHELRQVLAPRPQRGRLRLATAADLELATRWAYGFDLDGHGHADWDEAAQAAQTRVEDGELYLWELPPEGGAGAWQPVSMAVKNRPTRRGISISMVYTPPELRRRGHASACVSELSRLLLQSGYEFCALFADVANPTANRIYRRMGYRPLGEYHEYAFS